MPYLYGSGAPYKSSPIVQPEAMPPPQEREMLEQNLTLLEGQLGEIKSRLSELVKDKTKTKYKGMLQSRIKVCPYCGETNIPESLFCTQCGASLTPEKDFVPPSPGTTSMSPKYSPVPKPYPTQMTDAQLTLARKDEGISVLLTIVLAGLGHLFVGKIRRGLVFLVITIGLWIFGAGLSWIFGAGLSWIFGAGLFILPALVWYLYAIYDSYQLTKRYNGALYNLRRPPQEDEF
ncbi:zinc-ribbon domain-containing protein [Candidatus Borrarchaeum sp.]|uniref:zinc-ribbon domain-containing protein n=1 Tax=Candidatus Borrarchaeum sp. TaxID=2846742 RepID=UPI0031832F19